MLLTRSVVEIMAIFLMTNSKKQRCSFVYLLQMKKKFGIGSCMCSELDCSQSCGHFSQSIDTRLTQFPFLPSFCRVRLWRFSFNLLTYFQCLDHVLSKNMNLLLWNTYPPIFWVPNSRNILETNASYKVIENTAYFALCLKCYKQNTINLASLRRCIGGYCTKLCLNPSCPNFVLHFTKGSNHQVYPSP